MQSLKGGVLVLAAGALIGALAVGYCAESRRTAEDARRTIREDSLLKVRDDALARAQLLADELVQLTRARDSLARLRTQTRTVYVTLRDSALAPRDVRDTTPRSIPTLGEVIAAADAALLSCEMSLANCEQRAVTAEGIAASTVAAWEADTSRRSSETKRLVGDARAETRRYKRSLILTISAWIIIQLTGVLK